jgi:hypothetical protein
VSEQFPELGLLERHPFQLLYLYPLSPVELLLRLLLLRLLLLRLLLLQRLPWLGSG